MFYVQEENGQVRDNFVLVIMIGRGWIKWWIKLLEEENYSFYCCFINFCLVELIIFVIEDVVNCRDDIEVKYNLVKVMFGL